MLLVAQHIVTLMLRKRSSQANLMMQPEDTLYLP